MSSRGGGKRPRKSKIPYEAPFVPMNIDDVQMNRSSEPYVPYDKKLLDNRRSLTTQQCIDKGLKPIPGFHVPYAWKTAPIERVERKHLVPKVVERTDAKGTQIKVKEEFDDQKKETNVESKPDVEVEQPQKTYNSPKSQPVQDEDKESFEPWFLEKQLEHYGTQNFSLETESQFFPPMCSTQDTDKCCTPSPKRPKTRDLGEAAKLAAQIRGTDS